VVGSWKLAVRKASPLFSGSGDLRFVHTSEQLFEGRERG
jgi:hypothetical protein